MFAGKRQKASIIGTLALSFVLSTFSGAVAVSPVPGTTNYAPISVEDVRAAAQKQLNNAIFAGRISKEDADKYSEALKNAYSLSSVEETWADIEATAQEAKAKHPSIDHLIQTFVWKLDNLQKSKTIMPSAAEPYKERLKAIYRLKKQFYNNDKFYDFWEYTVLALDLSSLNDKLERALTYNKISIEQLNDLILRSDNYVARNQVCARGLSTYKSFEIEPDHLRQVRNELYTVMKDKAHSRLATPQVKEQLFKRLLATHYEGCSTLPSEVDVDKAIAEVNRLLDSGARNGNLSAIDGLRMQHELYLISELKKAYPGPNPGIDLVERELRKEEVRFMSLDLRFLQDWLGRVLRKDGEVQEGREQVMRLVRRLDLADFTHRISDKDVDVILSDLNTAIAKSSNDDQLAENCKNIEGKLDMMISDFSMSPANTTARASNIASLISRLKLDQSSASADKDRIQRLMNSADSMPAAKKYGVSFVAASELEMVRSKVMGMLKAQGSQG